MTDDYQPSIRDQHRRRMRRIHQRQGNDKWRQRTPRARYHRLVREGRYEMWWIESDDGWFHLIDYEDSHEPSLLYTPATTTSTTANSDYMGAYKEIHEAVVPDHIVGLVRGYQQRAKESHD